MVPNWGNIVKNHVFQKFCQLFGDIFYAKYLQVFKH